MLSNASHGGGPQWNRGKMTGTPNEKIKSDAKKIGQRASTEKERCFFASGVIFFEKGHVWYPSSFGNLHLCNEKTSKEITDL